MIPRKWVNQSYIVKSISLFFHEYYESKVQTKNRKFIIFDGLHYAVYDKGYSNLKLDDALIQHVWNFGIMVRNSILSISNLLLYCCCSIFLFIRKYSLQLLTFVGNVFEHKHNLFIVLHVRLYFWKAMARNQISIQLLLRKTT